MRQFIDAVRRITFGLRFRLLVLVLIVCTPLVWLTLHAASRERRRALAAWHDRSQRLTQLAHREEEDVVGKTWQLLLAVSQSSAVQSTNLDACKKSLDDVLLSHPNYSNLGLVGTNGEVLASALPPGEPGNRADRGFYRRVMESRAFAIEVYAGGRTNGKPTVKLGYPVLDSSGQVRGVVFAVMPLDWYTQAGFELATQVPRGATWTVINRDGTILARYPAPGAASGRPLPDHSLVKTIFSQPEGIVETPNSRDVPVVRAFALRNSQLVAGKVAGILSIPKPILFAAGNRALVRNLIALGLAVGLALVLGWVGSDILIIRPAKALVRASARLASGDLSTRTGLRHGNDELGQLTRAFDHMAQALEHRELERQLAQETLQTRDSMIRELPLLPAAVCVCDQYGAVELYNQTAVELWGYEPRDHTASPRFCGSYRLFHSDGSPMSHIESPAAEVLRAGLPVRNRELAIGRPDGTRVPVLANVVPLRDAEGIVIGVVSCYQDITDRKRAEERLRESNDKLQCLSRRLVESQELERRHIARELHDEVGQTLTVAEMNLQAVVGSSGAAKMRARLTESLQAVERVLKQVRDLSLDLRPSMLDDLGLEPALRWYTGRQAALAGLQAEFRAEPLDHRLDPVIETACFRIAQEALTNILKHACAQSFAVRLSQDKGRLHLCVRDDGVGFDVAALRERAMLGASLGLLSMEERAILSDGGLELKSAPGQGTEVHAWFPLRWRAPKS